MQTAQVMGSSTLPWSTHCTNNSRFNIVFEHQKVPEFSAYTDIAEATRLTPVPA